MFSLKPPPPTPKPFFFGRWAPPGALGDAAEDRPSLTISRATEAGGTSVIVAPGGGYRNLSMDKEGRQVASRFNAMGVTAYVLQYRLGPRYHHPIELGDAQRAIRWVRSHAAQLGVAPDRIGMMGFSAGGHLTATAGTHFDEGNPNASDPIDRVSSRPDFLILAYAVISFDPAIAHRGSAQALLGDNPNPKLVQDLSNELHVTAKTPPLRQAKVPAEMHIFQNARTVSGWIWRIPRSACGRRCFPTGSGQGSSEVTEPRL